MVPIPIHTPYGHTPYRYDMSTWDCRNAVLRQIIGTSEQDLNVSISVVQVMPSGKLLIEPLQFGKRLSPTSFEIQHLVEDCSKTYLEITSTAGSDVKLMLLYE